LLTYGGGLTRTLNCLLTSLSPGLADAKAKGVDLQPRPTVCPAPNHDAEAQIQICDSLVRARAHHCRVGKDRLTISTIGIELDLLTLALDPCVNPRR
jgi:hypothetical protein